MGLGSTLLHGAVAPVRIGLSATEIALDLALGAVRGVRRALEDGEGGARAASSERFETAVPAPPSRRRPSANGASAVPAAPRPESVEPPPPVPPAVVEGDAVPLVPRPPGAKEVDDDPVPVAEFGGEGADEPAGAEVRIEPPWSGYDGLTAAQIQRRLAGADRETVAAVLLYEGSKRARRSVVRPAEKRLRLLSA